MKSLSFAAGLALVLATSPVFAEEVTLPYGGLTLSANLETTGSGWSQGPVVLMTHGTLAHGGMEIMQGLQKALHDRGISSLALTLSLGLDQRQGMYDCAQPHTHRHTDALGEIGAWLDWLKAQGVSRVSLLGHSRGGNQAARFALSQPAAPLTQLILVAPQTWSEADTRADYQARYGQDLGPLLERARALKADGKADTLLNPVDFLYCEKAAASAAAFLSYYAPDPAMDTPSLLPEIPIPILVVAGSEDQVVKGLVAKVEPRADGQRVQLLVLEGADHFFRDLFVEDIADAIQERLGKD